MFRELDPSWKPPLVITPMIWSTLSVTDYGLMSCALIGPQRIPSRYPLLYRKYPTPDLDFILVLKYCYL